MTQKRNVQAIVLAGGFGTRLCPLTDAKPKPLVGILDKTVLENVLDAISSCHVGKVTVSTFYKSDMIEKLCREYDEKIECKREKEPLGTAGGVKYCAKEDFDAYLVVSGDGFFDFDLKTILDFHFHEKADVTVVTSDVENPTEYGVVVCDDNNNIVSFSEKPCWKKVRSGRVNTGIYVLSKYALESIPERRVYDFAKDLFPKLLKEGRDLKAITPEGSWCDIGSLDEYYDCNMRQARSNGNCNTEKLKCEGIYSDETSFISEKAHVGRNVSIKGSAVCFGSIVADDCDVFASLICRGSRIGRGSTLCRSIVGENVSVGENCVINDGCVIGDGSRIADGCVVAKNTHLRADSVIGRKDDKMTFSKEKYIFKDDGIAVFDEKEDFAIFMKFARSLAFAVKKREGQRMRISVGYSNEATNMKNAFMSGFLDTQTVIFDSSECSRDVLCHSVKVTCSDIGVYLEVKDSKPCCFVVGRDGFAINDETEREIVKLFSKPDEPCVFALDSHARKVKFPAVDVYKSRLFDFCSSLLGTGNLQGVPLCINSQDKKQFSPLSEVLSELGAEVVSETSSKIPVISVADGNLSIKYDGEHYDRYHLCAVVLENRGILGDFTVNMGENVPNALRKLALSITDRDKGISLLDDGCFLAAAVICCMSLTAKDLKTLISETQPFQVYSEEYIADVNRAATIEKLSSLYKDTKDSSDDGIHLCLANGTATVIPNRAKGFKIMAEAVNMEAAKEICVKIGEAIRS